MPEQNLAPNGTSQNPTDAPADGGQGVDFERSYNELRPQYTRTTQELAAVRESLEGYESVINALHDPDPAVRQQAMDLLGLELAEEGPQQTGAEEEWTDPLEQEVTELRQWRDEVEQQRQQEASAREDARIEALRDEFIDEEIAKLEAAHGELSEREQEVLGNLAISMSDEGVPDVEGAYAAIYDDILEAQRSRWIGTKRSAVQPPSGRTVTTAERPKNAEERIAFIDERVARLNDQQ